MRRLRAISAGALCAVLASGCLGTTSISATDSSANTGGSGGVASTPSAPIRLDRPLHLPRVSASGGCPRTSGGLRAKGVAIALGRGPVYPVLGMAAAPPAAGGVAGLRSDFHVLGWYLHKTLWAISPMYTGPILVRGERLDQPGAVRFGAGASSPRGSVQQSKPILRQPSDTSREWRYLPGYTLLRGSGCYGFQIDGTGFSQVVVFSASKAAQ
jgi:hypothetical protein